MLPLEEAVTRVLSAVPAPKVEEIALAQSHGRILAQEILAQVDLPGFSNSAMDGYAVRAADIAAATPAHPTELRLVGRVPAGEVFDGSVRPGECVRIFTGSPIPEGADAVVMQEDTSVPEKDAGAVLVLDSVQEGENIRRKGEDVERGTAIAHAGSALRPGQLALLAAAGVCEVRVGRQPRVSILATGSELQPVGEPLRPGHLYECNRLALAAMAERAGAVVATGPIVPDSLEGTASALHSAFEVADAVITCGGVSVGELDFVKQAFLDLGGTMDFWRVDMKPGRPFVLGRWGGKLLFGLPGNPVSALVTFALLVRPALRRWQGEHDVGLPTCMGTMAETLSNHDRRPHFVRVRLDREGGVHSAGLQASHALLALVRANGLLRVPPLTELPASRSVQVLLWDS